MSVNSIRRRWWLILLLVTVPPRCWAVDTRPVAVNNSLPIALGVGLSHARPATIVAEDGHYYSMDVNIQSHANDAGSSNEDLIIDAEVHSLGLQYDWGFTANWQASLTLRGTRVTAGRLDNLVDEWHDVFGLDSGDRSRQSRDQLLIRYRSGQSEQQVSRSESGLSELSASVARQLVDDGKHHLALHIAANLPISHSSTVTGSDALDLRIEIASSTRLTETVGLHANAAYLIIGDETRFGIETRSTAWQTSLGAHWKIGDKWRWSAQLDRHSALFNSDIKEIGQSAWQLALAGEYALQTQGPTLQLYFAEDLSVNRSADFAFGANIIFRH